MSDSYYFETPLTKEGQEEYIKRFKYDDGDGRKYRLSPLVSPSYSPSLVYTYKGYNPPKTAGLFLSKQWNAMKKKDV